MATRDRVEDVVVLGLHEDTTEPRATALMTGHDHAAVGATLERAHGHEPRQRHASRRAAHREATRDPHERARSDGNPQLSRPPMRASSAVTTESLIIHPNRSPNLAGCPTISSTNGPIGESV